MRAKYDKNKIGKIIQIRTKNEFQFVSWIKVQPKQKFGDSKIQWFYNRCIFLCIIIKQVEIKGLLWKRKIVTEIF